MPRWATAARARGAVAVAERLRTREERTLLHTIIFSGGNVDEATLRRVVNREI